MDVLVVGAGSLGSLVGGLLAPDHDVTLVGRDPHAAAIREDGLSLDGEVEVRVHPDATTDPAGTTADLAIVAVKAYDAASAAETIADCDVDAVWSLQNGLGNEVTLAAALDAPVLAGTATYGADRSAPGSVTCTGLGEAAIGPRPDTSTPEEDAALAERLAESLASAADGSADPAAGESDPAAGDGPGLSVAFEPAMPAHLWRKLAVNVGINPTTALARVRNGALAEGEVRETARTAARETARVAQARGVDLAERDAASTLDSVVAATAENRSSMLQDVERGRRTEIDAIAGAVVDRADEEGVAVPVTRTLASLVWAWERENGLR